MSRHAASNALRATICLLRRYHAITGTVLVACAYGLMNLGWRDTAEAAVVYFLGTHLLAALSRGNSRGRWVPLAWNLAFVAEGRDIDRGYDDAFARTRRCVGQEAAFEIDDLTAAGP